MSTASPSQPNTMPHAHMSMRISTLQNFFLWIFVFSGFFVLFEPAPYDLLAIFAMGLFFITGLKWNRALNPLFFTLFFYHLGAAICLMQVLDSEQNTVQWTIVGIFLAVTGLFIAMTVQENPLRQVRVIYSAWVWGAFVASLIGVLAYFNLIPSAETFMIYGNRVKSTFKDANVFGPFLVLPATYLVQQIYNQGFSGIFKTVPLLGVIVLALLLTFSRGAWGAYVATVLLMTLLTFLTSSSPRERSRILVLCILGSIAVTGLVVALLTTDTIGETLRARAALEQDYDIGAMGRFGRHLLGFQLVLDRPFGIGMLQFGRYFGEDPHNTYLNAFLSYTWMGGLAFLALVILTTIMNFRTVFVRTPWQRLQICAVAAFTVMMIEAWIIDIDHWRHMYLLLGLCWGMIAATLKWEQTNRTFQDRTVPV